MLIRSFPFPRTKFPALAYPIKYWTDRSSLNFGSRKFSDSPYLIIHVTLAIVRYAEQVSCLKFFKRGVMNVHIYHTDVADIMRRCHCCEGLRLIVAPATSCIIHFWGYTRQGVRECILIGHWFQTRHPRWTHAALSAHTRIQELLVIKDQVCVDCQSFPVFLPWLYDPRKADPKMFSQRRKVGYLNQSVNCNISFLREQGGQKIVLLCLASRWSQKPSQLLFFHRSPNPLFLHDDWIIPPSSHWLALRLLYWPVLHREPTYPPPNEIFPSWEGYR